MLRQRFTQAMRAIGRRSPTFEKFLHTRSATVLAGVFAFGALAGAVVGVWRSHWIDALVRLALGAMFAAWTVAQIHRPHGGPPRAV